jgi:allophanate hydrolase
VAPELGSVSTNTIAGIGGLNGRCLEAGDEIAFLAAARRAAPPVHPAAEAAPPEGPIRIIWGLHADHFAPEIRSRFLAARFVISAKLNRMGVRLDDPEGLFRDLPPATLVSDAVVPGDVQILGDGTPIVLMRDHQPTGGYPRIATLIGVDFDRFAQMRPGTGVSFASVALGQAQTLRRARP